MTAGPVAMRALLVAFAFAFLSLGVAAQEDRAEFRFESPARVRFELDQTQEGSQAANTRRQIDQYGDGNGTVTSPEVEAAEQEFLNVSRQFQSDQAGSAMTLDGVGHDNFTVETIDIQGAEGPTTSTASIKFVLVAHMSFPINASKEHTLRIPASDDTQEDIDSAKIILPLGYRVKSTSGLPEGAEVSSDRREITFTGAAQSNEEMTIVFSQGDANGIGTGTTLWLIIATVLAVGIVGGVIIARARRHP